MRDFHNLKVWQKGHELALAVYEATREFPQAERFGLASQVRRAGVSIPSNIAEGCGRDRELSRFVHIALGSASELQYQLLLARDLSYLTSGEHDQLEARVTEIKKMLSSLVQKLTADN
jgi:four helix bundle protein